MNESVAMKFKKAKNALKELWGKYEVGWNLSGRAHFAIGDVMEQCSHHLKLVEKLADSVYPEEIAQNIVDKVHNVFEIVNELCQMSREYDNEHRELLTDAELSDEYDPNEWNEIRRLSDEHFDNYNKKLDEFKGPYLELLTELEKWEVAKYPQPSAIEVLVADLDTLAKRLARGEISGETYKDAKKRLEDELRKIKRMGTENTEALCPKCGKPTASEATYCGFCGAKLGD